MSGEGEGAGGRHVLRRLDVRLDDPTGLRDGVVQSVPIHDIESIDDEVIGAGGLCVANDLGFDDCDQLHDHVLGQTRVAEMKRAESLLQAAAAPFQGSGHSPSPASIAALRDVKSTYERVIRDLERRLRWASENARPRRCARHHVRVSASHRSLRSFRSTANSLLAETTGEVGRMLVAAHGHDGFRRRLLEL